MNTRSAPAGVGGPARGRRIVVAAVAFGVLATLPAWQAGFMADDYAQLAQVEGWSPTTRSFGLYDFVPPDTAVKDRLIHRGVFPWFMARDLELSLWRPLTSALFRLDHALWGRAPLPYHVHSALWYAALLLAAVAVFRRTLGGGLAVLAAVLFCLDDSHAMSASWTAARHGLIGVLLAMLGLLAHLRWREQGWRPGAWLAPLACAAGLLGGESALGAMVYLWAFELVSRRPDRLRAMLPSLAVAVAYLIVYQVGGYGARGSSGYLDPAGDPLGFLVQFPQRLLLLVSGLLLSVPVDLVLFQPAVQPVLVACGAAALLGAGLWFRSARRRASEVEARAVLAFALGAGASLIAAVPGLPGERLLLAPSVGGSAVLAFLLRDGWRLLRARPRRWPVMAGLGTGVIALTAVLLSALGLLGKSVFLARLGQAGRAVAREAEVDAPVPARVVVVHLDDLLALFLPLVRAVDAGIPLDRLSALATGVVPPQAAGAHDRLGLRGWSVLSLGAAQHFVRRTGDDRLELWTEQNSLVTGGLGMAFRGPRGMPAGTVVDTAGHRITVLEDRAGLPSRIEVRFTTPLDDPSLILLEWRDGRLRRLQLAPGAAKALERLPR